MDKSIFASMSHTHYGYELGMLKVPAYIRAVDVLLKLTMWYL